MANRHRKAISTEKPDPSTVASVETVTAGDTDPVSDTGGGYGLQRFEISNLSVPAGTNWSSTPHVLQSNFGDWPLWSLPLYVIRLQATDPLATGDKIWAQLDTETGSTLDFCELNDSAESAWSSSLKHERRAARGAAPSDAQWHAHIVQSLDQSRAYRRRDDPLRPRRLPCDLRYAQTLY
jgi:hypothetical protein